MKNSNFRRAIATAIFAAIVLFAVNSFAQFAGGDGSEENPWQVGTAGHIGLLRNYLGAQHTDKHFIQTAHIDVGGEANWVPIAEATGTRFHFKYDGDDFEIRNVRRGTRSSNFGFFGYGGDGCVLKNVKLRNINLTINNGSAALVCQAVGIQLINCSVTGSINRMNAGHGGIIATCTGNSNIHRCWVDLTTVEGGSSASGQTGGIVGNFNSTGSITECYALINMTWGGSNPPCGGLVARMVTGSISDCYVIGSISTTQPQGRIGGFIGDNSNRPVTNCYAIVNLITEGPGPVGGFIAQGAVGSVTNCYWNPELTGIPSSPGGGEPLNTLEMLNRNSFVRWDFEGDDPIWKIDENSIPYLAWEGDEAPDHCCPPAALPPYGLTVVEGDEIVNLTWERPSVTAPSGYNVYRDRNRINVNLVQEERYEDNTVTNYTQYSYYITAVYAAQEESDPSGSVAAVPHGFEGSGSIEDPFLIYNVVQLNAVRYFQESHFRQMEDLDLGVEPWNEGQGWVPLADNNNQFKGRYNGGDHVIKGLTINRNASYQSLFGYGNAAIVTGVRLKDVDITGTTYTGALFGRADNTTVTSCCVEGSVKGTYYMGGMTGYMSAGSITGCYVAGEVIVPGTSATGYIGGIAGYFTGVTNITNCYSIAMVQGNQTRIGGLVGYKTGANSSINNSYCTGAVIANNEVEHVGGLVGQHASGSVNNCFWNTETTGRETSPGGGIGTNTSQMVRRGTYTDANWEFPDIWGIAEGETYPFLAWEDGPSLHNRPGPSGLTADGDHEAREITLEWNMIGNPNRYNVYRDNQFLRSVDHPTRELVDGNLELFGEYAYYVEAVFVEGEVELISAPSNTVVIVLSPSFAGGDGSANSPYQVANESHLDMIRYFLGDHFIQTADLDLHREAWVPIGDANSRFRGSYDGDGFRISEMNINRTTAYQGLFGYTQGATLRNIILEDVDLRIGQYSGALAGRTETTNISNVTVTGNIQAVSTYVGGIVGYATSSTNTISDCSVSGTMTASSNYIGGIIGNGYVTVNDCTTDLEITTAGIYAGGIAGYTASTMRINRCAVLGNITSTSTSASIYLGGLLGRAYATYIEESYVTGNVTSSAQGGRDYVGGLVGVSQSTNYTVLRSYATGNVTGRNYVGGLIGSTQNTNATSIEDSYAIGTVNGENHVGGLIGGNTNASLSVLRCYSIGRVFGNTNVGGFIGSGNGTTTNSYWNTATSGQEESPGGGLPRDNRHMRHPYTEDTYIGWNFNTVWAHDVDPSWNDGYPRLRYQERPIEFIEIPQLKVDIVQIGGADHFRIRWELVDGARSYRIYFSRNPSTTDWGDPIRTVGGDVTTYTELVEDNRAKFFYVTASTREAR